MVTKTQVYRLKYADQKSVYNTPSCRCFSVRSCTTIMESKTFDSTSFVITTEPRDLTKKTPPQLMLSTLYGLGKTFSKKVFIGLEIGSDGLGAVSIRLTGNDYVGIKFSHQSWGNFERSFDHIRKFFASGRDNSDMMDQRIMGSGFSVRFTIAHSDKAIEIEELFDDADSPPQIKKFRRSIVMKASTFWNLKRYTTCINTKIAHLLRILPSWNFIMQKIVSKSEEAAAKGENLFSDFDVNVLADPELLPSDFKEMVEQLRENDLPELSISEIDVIYNEIIYLKFVSNKILKNVFNDN